MLLRWIHRLLGGISNLLTILVMTSAIAVVILLVLIIVTTL